MTSDNGKSVQSDENTPSDAEEAAHESVVDQGPAEPEQAAEGASAGQGASGEAPEATKLREQLLRTAADFDNFRKRTKRDLEDAERRGKEEVIKEILPVIDNLERAVEAATAAKDAAAVAEGVRMVLKQFEDVSGHLNLERVKAVGERFDPSVHDAVQQVETSEHPPGSIVNEVVPGYRMDNRLIRAAMVVVAKPPAEGSGDGKGS